MKISILCENAAGGRHTITCLAEWGFSAFIQVGEANILFDTGHTEVYKHNAKCLNIDLENTDFIVLSHNHWDHTGGLRFHNFKTKKKIIIHPQIMKKLPQDQAQKIKDDFDVIASTKPLEFSPNIYYLGEIRRRTDFEQGTYKGEPIPDDSAIAIKTTRGVVVITGCSHSGVCNICEYAKEVTGQKLYAVVGGFHLFEDDEKAVKGTMDYFKTERPEFLCPMHCVDLPSLAEFYHNFKNKKYASGDTIELKD